jgi:hypothetical protein
MKLNIINRTAGSYNESVGISEQRADELSDQLDVIMAELTSRKQTVYVCDIMEQIARISNNIEEVIYCTINHCNWAMVSRGIVYCPTKKKRHDTKTPDSN